MKTHLIVLALLLTIAVPSVARAVEGPDQGTAPPVERGAPKFFESITLGPNDVAEWAVATKKVPPNYSTKLKRSCGTGSAHVRGIVGRDGKVSNVNLISATCPGFADETIRTFQKWRFKPATLNGLPVATYFDLTLNFKFQN